jgi:SAM-dependent methyltransferase
MSDWTAGYVVDRDAAYTYGYYTELSPLRARFAFLINGLVPPKFENACELGYGQGLSVNFHAAATATRWWGTDFNPAQAAFAQELASVSGAGASLVDESFADFCARKDLPDFDYIGLHGIWSWISDENRALLVDFLRRKLRVGGVLYISYNTMPGWAAFAPMRHLLAEHAEVMAVPGRGIVSRVDAAVEFAEKLMTVQPRFAAVNPQIGERLKGLKGQNRHYLAHEYFNQYWSPIHFAEMAEWLGPGKLDYACTAHPIESLPLSLTEVQRAFLAEIPDRMFRETVRDFIVNQQFRRDYWVRGVRTITGQAQMEALRALRFVLVTPRGDVPKKVMTSMGEATLQPAVYDPILDAISDGKPRSIGELEQLVKPKPPLAQLMEVFAILVGAGVAAEAQADDEIASVRARTQKLNLHLMERAKSSGEVSFLGSPVTGGALAVPMLHQLFLLAHRAGVPVDRWASSVWDVIALQGQKLIKEGKVLSTPEENIRELEQHAVDFAKKRMPVLELLQVI